MSGQIHVTALCPACRMVLFLRTPIVLDDDGGTAIDRSDINRAIMIHLRMSCSAVARRYDPADVDEDEGVP